MNVNTLWMPGGGVKAGAGKGQMTGHVCVLSKKLSGG